MTRVAFVVADDYEDSEFRQPFVKEDRPVAAIGHAASLLVEADGVKGRCVTSWPSVRKPADLEPFCLALLASTEAVAA